jgi:O-methyltransferase
LRYVRLMFSLFRSLPSIQIFLTSREVGGDYGIGFRAKLGLLIRFYRNTRKIETLSDVREHMELAAAVLRVPRAIEGSVVECGCYVGGSTANLSLVCAMTGRKLMIFDSFAGLPEPEQYDRWHHAIHAQHTDVYYKGRFAAAKETVQKNISKFGEIGACEFRVGYYNETMSDIHEPIVMAFLDVDLIDSLKPCLTGLWPNLQPGCRIYTHEARNLAFISVYFDQAWWRQNLDEDAPGFVGSGVGLPLGLHSNWGSELGYAQKPEGVPEIAPDQDPEVLEQALFDWEKAAFAQLRADEPAPRG